MQFGFRKGIGHELIEFAIKEFGADHLWALEKNVKALHFTTDMDFALQVKSNLSKHRPHHPTGICTFGEVRGCSGFGPYFSRITSTKDLAAGVSTRFL